MSFPRRGILLGALALMAGCSAYRADFRQAVAVMPESPSTVLGPWEGEWRSEMNGHHGPLWCVISEDGEGTHAFRYRAGWGMLQFGDYTHIVTTSGEGRMGVRFSGDMELSGGFGTYAVTGRVTPHEFDARFESDGGDRGTMVLSRPE